ncbi:hypothetical protein GIB67_029655 [Kingdonia uniflora]|uniref:Uncharacterized protein n=1 Tax=Kingdonia uniflora TaxID=39325 RepID=A0A7J7LLF7_9MAGN|nr:hypothetical protein GIB67_029655 [Kingdonia uniflora]
MVRPLELHVVVRWKEWRKREESSLLNWQGRKKTDTLLRDIYLAVGHSNKRKEGSSSAREGEMDYDRNFLWSGNSTIRKVCVVGWNKTCKPRKEGAIDIRSLKEVNLALLMKFAWNFLNGQDDWAKLMRAKFNTKAGNRIYSTQGSSVWAGIRGAVTEVEQRSGWIVGDGKDIDL